jgi:23S rRNA pseudouridine1911/1915/1917 synthase
VRQEKEEGKVFSGVITGKQWEQRVDLFLSSTIPDLSRSRVQDLIKQGFVSINGQTPKASYRLKIGDEVRLRIPPASAYHLKPEPIQLSIVHEDPFLLVLDKPPGLVMHPAPGHPTGTLVHGLLDHCKDLSGIGGFLRPGIVHRLDKDTSGLIVVAKNDRVHAFLARQFKSGVVMKKYMAIVHGLMEEGKGQIHLPIARHPHKRKEMAVLPAKGKQALTLWKRVDTMGGMFSLLSITPKTGRTHQIRVHLSHEGHPIVGDPVYGYRGSWWKRHFPRYDKEWPVFGRQMLHAEALGFYHPDTESYCEFRSPLPDDMVSAITLLKDITRRDEMH